MVKLKTKNLCSQVGNNVVKAMQAFIVQSGDPFKHYQLQI